jgi:polyhydroxyalkanoate synthase
MPLHPPSSPSHQLHLALLQLLLTSGSPAWLLAKRGLLPWKPGLQRKVSNLLAEATDTPDLAIIQGIQEACLRQGIGVLRGLQRLQGVRLELAPIAAPVVWQVGTSALREYTERHAERSEASLSHSDLPSSGEMLRFAQHDAPIPLLIIPPLINRAQVVDLVPGLSLIERLRIQGYACHLLDWQEPGEEEEQFTAADYVEQRILPALQAMRERYGRLPAMLGYCMGGVLAVGAACVVPESIEKLILLATPWDFHSRKHPMFSLSAEGRGQVERILADTAQVPGQWMQYLFHMLDPWRVQERLARFADLEEASEAYQHFLAVEAWLQHPVPIGSRLVREMLIDWVCDNRLARGEWRIAGQAVHPETLALPVEILLPTRDRIVPRSSAMALANLIPHATVRTIRAGHISMLKRV